MLRSKTLQVVAAGLLLVSLLLPMGGQLASEVKAAEGDAFTYTFDDGTVQGWSPRGGVTLSATSESAVSGVYSLKTTGRTAAWNGPSLNVKSLLQPGASYEISASVKLPEKAAGAAASTVKLTMQEDPAGGTTAYPNIVSASIADNSWVQLRGTYSYSAPMDGLTLYVESSEAQEVILVDDVVIRAVVQPPADQSGIATDFENDTAQGWLPRMGSETLAVTDADAKSGTYSLLTTGRTQTYSGPSLSVTGKMHEQSKYKLSVWVKLAPGESAADLRLSIQRGYQGTNSYDTVVGNTPVTSGEWVRLTGDYQLRSAVDSLSVYVESGSGTPSFYLDDFTLAYIPPVAIEQDIPSLHEALAGQFKYGVGAAVEPFELEGQHGELLKKHFNSVVAGNVMKPDYLQKQEGIFTFERADAIVEFAKANGMSIRGHTLVWHSQTPDWFFRDLEGKEMVDETDPVKRQANKELLLKRMETHIKTVVEHFGTDVYAYDVVNEVISDSAGLRDSKWYRICGVDYIKEAFRYARKYAPEGTLLYINDYNTHSPRKAQDLYNLVTELLADGVPVDGVGHQTHIRIDSPSLKQITDSIEMFGKLGLDNQITELDVTVYSNDTDKYETVPEEVLLQQGYRYGELMQAFIRLKPYISSVVFWGMADDNTWLKNFPIARLDLPLLFDEQLQSKPAFWAIVDPSRLPARYESHDAAFGTAKVDQQEELLWQAQKAVRLSSETVTASFKTLWDAKRLYVLVDVNDSTRSPNDRVELFVDDNNGRTAAYEADDKHYTLHRSRKSVSGVSYNVKERSGGYRLEASIPITAAMENGLKGFDIRITDADTTGAQVSWSDTTASQQSDTSRFGELKLVKAVSIHKAVKGKPVIDGAQDSGWSRASELSTDVQVQGTGGASAKVKVMWDENYLYVLAKVDDRLLSDASANAYEQDSVEIFLDADNSKSSEYEPDDGQFRINFHNVRTFGGNAADELIQSAVKIVEGGYVVEAAIKLPDSKPCRVIGFDIQVNNDEDGDGKRDTVTIWNDQTGDSYRSTAKFGAVHLAN
ncbi:endo-1,4-beta-xylanase [Paenibacillus tarimensis]|uniref:endo-1,4-beta-xylanase n=1 Tax=Paenibacillus tarimensis TaxID=416012 RepID=UPI001F491DBC|nr:endo-1,4-beta-xylanase [Paenibacillus tarimensis]MCF2945739.1 endo-1,4-beta-xylanase [Paenibacillus tarimensis]